jgi:hypothetical protein
MVECIPCYTAPVEHWVTIPTSRLASRKTILEQNIKIWNGPALYIVYI